MKHIPKIREFIRRKPEQKPSDPMTCNQEDFWGCLLWFILANEGEEIGFEGPTILYSIDISLTKIERNQIDNDEYRVCSFLNENRENFIIFRMEDIEIIHGTIIFKKDLKWEE